MICTMPIDILDWMIEFHKSNLLQRVVRIIFLGSARVIHGYPGRYVANLPLFSPPAYFYNLKMNMGVAWADGRSE